MLQSELILKRLGLSEHEAKIYLLGLKLGPSVASQLAKQSGLGRTLVYHLLGQLQGKGLLSQQGSGNGKKFAMEPPTRLLDIIERKQKELEGMAVQVTQIAEEIKSRTMYTAVPQIRVFEGVEGLKNLAQETLITSNTEIKSIVPLEYLLKIFDKFFLRYWFIERKKKNITGKTIFTGTPHKPFSTELIKQLLNTPYASSFLHQWKKSPANLCFSNIIIILGDKVAIGSSATHPSVFVIESAEFKETMETLFNDLWKRSLNLKYK